MKLNAQVIEKMQSVNLDAVDKETLVDASGFVFDNSLPLEKRAARMLEQLKNPYHRHDLEKPSLCGGYGAGPSTGEKL